MSRSMKTLHLSYMPLYAIFVLIQIINSFGAINMNCGIWYSLSIIFLWCARFIFALEMFHRAYMIYFALALHANRRRHYYPVIIIFIICLVSVLLFNTGIESIKYGVCIPQYNNTLAPVTVIHIVIGIISVGSVAILVKQLNFYQNAHRNHGVVNDDESYQMRKLIRKFIILMISIIISSLFILFCAIYADFAYGILIGYDGLVIMCLDILLYKKYDKTFTFFCQCFLPSKPPDKVKNLQEITSLFADKYENKFESVILETLKNNSIAFISDDVISIIVSYIKPITALETSFIYRPYWTPTVTERMDGDIEYFKQSKYGGVPYLKYGEEWPRCLRCDHKLYLYLQLNMNTLPEEYTNKWLLNSDIYRNYLLQYFQCIESNCDDSMVRFVQIEQGKTEDIEDDSHWKDCLRIYNDFKMQKNAINANAINVPAVRIWMECIINRWSKEQIDNGPFNIHNNDNDDEKDGIYNFDKYEYETPSLREYDIFYEGIFDGLQIISKEVEKKGWDINTIHHLLKKPNQNDKLFGYFCCLAEESIIGHIPICNICNTYMNNMIFQLDGSQSGYKYSDDRVGGIFICDNHPFQPQLVLLNTNQQRLPF